MNKFTAITLATFMTSGIANAATPCDGFRVTVLNNMDHKIVAVNASVSNNATIDPKLGKIDSKTEKAHTINHTLEGENHRVHMVYQNKSLDKVTLNFNVKNNGEVCEFENVSEASSHYSLEVADVPEKGKGVRFTIMPK